MRNAIRLVGVAPCCSSTGKLIESGRVMQSLTMGFKIVSYVLKLQKMLRWCIIQSGWLWVVEIVD